MEYLDKGDYYEIITDGVTGKIDKEDLSKILPYKWKLHHGYFYCSTREHLLAMHQLIFGELSDINNVIDHTNRDRIDNRKKNLREVSRSINVTNAKERSDKKQDLPRGIVFRKENPEMRADGRGQKRYAGFEVQWSVEGKRKSKTSSLRKYGGYEAAKQEAINFRNQKLEEMKI